MIPLGLLTYYFWQKHSEIKKRVQDDKRIDEMDFDSIQSRRGEETDRYIETDREFIQRRKQFPQHPDKIPSIIEERPHEIVVKKIEQQKIDEVELQL